MTVNKDVSQMPSQAGESEVPAASTSKPGLYTGAWDSDNTWESQRVYHDLTEISFQQLDRIGAQPRNEVQLEGKKVPFPAHLNLWFENWNHSPDVCIISKAKANWLFSGCLQFGQRADNFSFQRIAAFRDETGPPSAEMTYTFHLQCQLHWTAGDFLEGHVKRILGLFPGSVGKSKDGWLMRAARGRQNESMWAGEKNRKKKTWADPKSPAISFYRWEVKAQKNEPKALQIHGLRTKTWIFISEFLFIVILLSPAVDQKELLLKMQMRCSPPAPFSSVSW